MQNTMRVYGSLFMAIAIVLGAFASHYLKSIFLINLTLYHIPVEPKVKWLCANSKKTKQHANNSQAV